MPAIIMLLLATQIICALIFVADVLRDLANLDGPVWELLPEALACLALLGGIFFEAVYLVQLLRRKEKLEHSVSLASAALHEVVEKHFDDWVLTPSERDVAGLMVKGLSIIEIAGVRGSAEGTVKAHLNGIYRKANARNRAEVLSHIMDTLIDKPLLPPGEGRAGLSRSAP